ncbi:MAG: hypothetical protein Q9195_003165 [Heterodermia aff. obscurata]
MSIQACPTELVLQIVENLGYMDLKSFRQTERRMRGIFTRLASKVPIMTVTDLQKQPVHPPDRLSYAVEAARLANNHGGPHIPLRILEGATFDLEESIKYSLESALGVCFVRQYFHLLIPTIRSTTFTNRSLIPIEDFHLSLLMTQYRYIGEPVRVELYQYYIWELRNYIYSRVSSLSFLDWQYVRWENLLEKIDRLHAWDCTNALWLREARRLMQLIKDGVRFFRRGPGGMETLRIGYIIPGQE